MNHKEESNIKVSVIVPVWNPGPGISRCIESLIHQTLNDIEIIFVDDCGTDGAMELVEEKALSDDRIRIIKNNKNSGAGFSRNHGIEEARGEYLSFVDADDFVEKDFLALLYNKARTHNVDIAKGTYDGYYEDGSHSIFIPQRTLNTKIQQSIDNHTPLMESFYSKHVTAIYRASLFTHPDVRYGDMVVSEDTLFLLRLCAHTDSIVIEKGALYHYTTTDGSISSEMSEPRLLEYANSFKILLNTLTEKYAADCYSQNYAATRLLHMFFLYFRAGFIPGLENARIQFLNEVRNTVLGLPFTNQLTERYPGIKVFIECGVALPHSFSSSSRFTRNALFYATAMVKQWVDFFQQYPSYIPICEKTFVGLLRKKPMLFTETLEQKPSHSLFLYASVQKELRRLPLKYYLRLTGSLLANTTRRIFRKTHKHKSI